MISLTCFLCLSKVPAGPPKKELLDQLDKVPTYVQTLQFTVKEPTVGKSATFVKVDHVIQETKNLMNIISKVVSTCFDCANKVSYLTHMNVRKLSSLTVANLHKNHQLIYDFIKVSLLFLNSIFSQMQKKKTVVFTLSDGRWNMKHFNF